MRVVVLLSGGVDSAAAAKILVEKGEDVVGITLDLGLSRSCELSIAQRVCQKIGIPHYVYKVADNFESEIVKTYHDKLLKGLTPNPCPRCNIDIKWRHGLRIADEVGARYVATGHYARKRHLNGNWELLEASDRENSQSYFLALITQEILERIIFPIGDLKQSDVYQIGSEIGAQFLSNQEICFEPNLPRNEGDIVDRNGCLLGKHRGHYFYTIGQRHGLGIGGGKPLYVVSKDIVKNKIVLGFRDDLFGNCLYLDDVHWIGPVPDLPLSVQVRIRYQSSPADALIEEIDGNYRLLLSVPQFAITPGQLAVLSNKEVVLGAGWIGETDGNC